MVPVDKGFDMFTNITMKANEIVLIPFSPTVLAAGNPDTATACIQHAESQILMKFLCGHTAKLLALDKKNCIIIPYWFVPRAINGERPSLAAVELVLTVTGGKAAKTSEVENIGKCKPMHVIVQCLTNPKALSKGIRLTK
jgi:hypothetical protein